MKTPTQRARENARCRGEARLMTAGEIFVLTSPVLNDPKMICCRTTTTSDDKRGYGNCTDLIVEVDESADRGRHVGVRSDIKPRMSLIRSSVFLHKLVDSRL
eukprot:751167-Hanusia_phi.AAC.2